MTDNFKDEVLKFLNRVLDIAESLVMEEALDIVKDEKIQEQTIVLERKLESIGKKPWNILKAESERAFHRINIPLKKKEEEEEEELNAG